MDANELIYPGITIDKIEEFNRCMLQTMKSVYAYNPDYNTTTSYKGDIITQDWTPVLTSNLISNEASLDFSEGKDFNNYIYLKSSEPYSTYLTNL
jgi:hypothetical protein